MNIFELPSYAYGILAAAVGYYIYKLMMAQKGEAEATIQTQADIKKAQQMRSIEADSQDFLMRWERFFKENAKAEIKARCLANSTRTRHSRSTLRKTR